MDTQTNPPADPKALAAENQRLRDQQAELQELRKRNAELESGLDRISGDERIIRKKMAAGLTRDQAVAAIEHQRKFDVKSKEVATKRQRTAKK